MGWELRARRERSSPVGLYYLYPDVYTKVKGKSAEKKYLFWDKATIRNMHSADETAARCRYFQGNRDI